MVIGVVLRTLSNIYDEALSENNKRLVPQVIFGLPRLKYRECVFFCIPILHHSLSKQGSGIL